MLSKLISMITLLSVLSCVKPKAKLPKKVCKKVPIEGLLFGDQKAYTEKCEIVDR